MFSEHHQVWWLRPATEKEQILNSRFAEWEQFSGGHRWSAQPLPASGAQSWSQFSAWTPTKCWPCGAIGWRESQHMPEGLYIALPPPHSHTHRTPSSLIELLNVLKTEPIQTGQEGLTSQFTGFGPNQLLLRAGRQDRHQTFIHHHTLDLLPQWGRQARAQMIRTLSITGVWIRGMDGAKHV